MFPCFIRQFRGENTMFSTNSGGSHDKSHQSTRRKEGASRFDLLLTGDRHDNRIHVQFYGTSELIPCASLEALVEMIVARIETESGYCEIARRTILRLRKEIDACAGPGCGRRLLETGFKGQYRITTRKSDILTRIGLTPCFFEFVDLAIISLGQATTLRRGCALCDLAETARGPDWDRTGTDKP